MPPKIWCLCSGADGERGREREGRAEPDRVWAHDANCRGDGDERAQLARAHDLRAEGDQEQNHGRLRNAGEQRVLYCRLGGPREREDDAGDGRAADRAELHQQVGAPILGY